MFRLVSISRFTLIAGLFMLPACMGRGVIIPMSPPIANPVPVAVESTPITTVSRVDPPVTISPTEITVAVGLPRLVHPSVQPPLVPSRREQMEEASSAPPLLSPIVAKAHPVEPPLLASLRLYMDRRVDDAITQLKVYDATNQELLIAMIPPLMRATEGSLNQADPQDVAGIVEQLQTAANVVKSRAALRLENTCFCKRSVVKFGIFDPIGENHSFRPGEMAELYVELRNVVGEPHTTAQGDRGILTVMTSELVLRDSANQLIWRRDCDRSEFSRSLQHDHYVHYRFSVPNVPAGRYTLWLNLVEKATSRSVKRALEFRVTALPGPAM